jgi:hypothetical protein
MIFYEGLFLGETRTDWKLFLNWELKTFILTMLQGIPKVIFLDTTDRQKKRD